DLGNDVTARLFQSNSDLQLWWQNGPTSIRLESGGAPGTTMLTREQVISVAASLRPVGTAEGQAATPAVTAGATVSKAEQAVTIARGVLASLGGNDQATVSRVSLAALSDETALGMPQPKGVRLSPLVWVIAFKDGLLPAD